MRSISNKDGTETRQLRIGRKILDKTGLRLTSQRALILEIIQEEGGHLDADEVYRRAREKHPRLSLSTVYRTLQLLKKLGLVEELHFSEAHHHYEVKSSSEHNHLLCLGCGKIIEFKYPMSRRIKEDVTSKKGFEVTGVETWMTGYCTGCRKGKR